MVLMLIPVGVATGCSNVVLKQPALRMQYYTLDYAPTRSKHPARLSSTIVFQRFRVAPDYNSRQMVYSESVHTKNAYVYHQWRSHPGDLVPYLLSRDLDHSGHFNAVHPPGSKTQPTFRIEGLLEKFYERDEKFDYEAVLAITITVVTNDPSKRVPTSVMHQHYHATVPMDGRSAGYLAKAMSRAVSKISGAISNDLVRVLAKHPTLLSKDSAAHDTTP